MAPVLAPYEWDRALTAPTVQAAVDLVRAITGKRDAATLGYVVAMRSAWGDCSSNVAGVKAWTDALPE